ncbi:LysR family transcriptional regulator [Oceanimonas sp. NS1]|nr:LysR family transcriptional regulator [Oceanimonas sp. NS1]
MLPEFKVAQLRHFVWVAELKGFHLAAEKAHRTQPAISLSIRDLESKLGEALFEKRNSRTAKTELTPLVGRFCLGPRSCCLIMIALPKTWRCWPSIKPAICGWPRCPPLPAAFCPACCSTLSVTASCM